METKTFVVDVKVDDNDEDFGPHGGFIAMISDPTVDRDGERILKGAFDPLPARIPIDVDHSRRVEDTIGSAVPYYDGDKVMAKASFASTERAQLVRKLMKEGHIAGVSVMFARASRGEPLPDGSIPIHSAELVKFGVVDVPAHPKAHALSVKKLLDNLAEPPAEDAVDTDTVAKALGVDADEVEARLSGDQIEALAAVARTMPATAVRQAYRALGGQPKAASNITTSSTGTSNSTFADVTITTSQKTEAQIRAEVEAELLAKMRREQLNAMLDPEVIRAQFGTQDVKRQLYGSMLKELAESIVLVPLPEGVDYVKAAAAAQAAVDLLATETPTEVTPVSPSVKDADVERMLAEVRAEVMQAQNAAAEAVANLRRTSP